VNPERRTPGREQAAFCGGAALKMSGARREGSLAWRDPSTQPLLAPFEQIIVTRLRASRSKRKACRRAVARKKPCVWLRSG
jgi:hypothetical protein